jgi:hypothetical protein
MRSMRADGLEKVLAGRTTLEEVPRVTPADHAAGKRELHPSEPPSPPEAAVRSGRHPVEVAG